MRRRYHLFWIIPILLILAIAGYAFYRFKDFKKPYFVDIDTDFMIPGHAPEAKVKSTVYVVNPNDFDIKFDSVRYKLFIDNEQYSDGKMTEHVALKANDTTAVTLPFDFDMEKFRKRFERPQRDSGTHRLEFEFFTNIMNKSILIPYTYEKTIPIFKKPKIKVEDVKLTKFGLKETELEVYVKLDNPNDVKMLSDKLYYSFHIENEKIAEGAVNQNKFLPAEGSTTLKLPVRLNLKEALNEIGLLKKKYKGKDYTFRFKAELKNTKPKNPRSYDFDIYKTGKMDELVQKFKEERKKRKLAN